MASKHNIAIIWAVLAAAAYAISTPISKILLHKIPPTMMAALLYLGAGIGLSIVIFGQALTASYVIALVIMIAGAYFASVDSE